MFSKSRVRFYQLYEDAKSYFINMYGQAGKMFSVSTAWGQILQAVFSMGEMIMYYIEDSITELNLKTASRADSIRGIISLTGHNPVRSISATGDLYMAFSGDSTLIKGKEIIIPNFTKLICSNNGLPYILDLNKDEIRIPIQSNQELKRVKIRQGEIGVSIFTGTGNPIQSFEVNSKPGRYIDQYFFNVYINGKAWTRYESLYDMGYQTEGYISKTGNISGIDIIFGNGYIGKMPDLGSEIRIEYLVNDGEGGNIRENSNIQWQWVESGYDIFGNEVNLNTSLKTQSTIVEFGSNAETLEMTKLLGPKISKSMVLANADNYFYYFSKWNYFSQIHAYRKANDLDLSDDNIVYLFLIPDVKKRIQLEENYFTIPLSSFKLTDSEKERIHTSLEESGSKIIGTDVSIVDPIFSKYVLFISLVIFEGYSIESIQDKIISLISDFFLSLSRKDRIPKSDLITIIEGIDGVDSISLFFVSEKNEINKKINPDSPDIGLDSWGDVILEKDELFLLRGGWKDRNDVLYDDSSSKLIPSAINIEIREIIKKDISIILNEKNKSLIK